MGTVLNGSRLLLALVFAQCPLAAATLANDYIRAEFNRRGLTSLHDASGRGYRFAKDDFMVTLDGKDYDSAQLEAPELKTGETILSFLYKAGPYLIDVRYELHEDWHFLSKQIFVSSTLPLVFHVNAITIFRDSLSDTVSDAYVIARGRANLGTGDYGVCLRFEKSRGLLVAAQNPFLGIQRQGNDFSVSYKPDMDWNPAWNDFVVDRGLLAPYKMADESVPQAMLPEWRMGPADDKPGMDRAEITAYTDMVRAFLLYKPGNPLNIMVGWCANDYQIDIATPEGRAEYKRIIDSAAALGAEHVLFAPSNSQVSRRLDSRDDWKWEHTLWLGLGEKIRRQQWDPETGEIPPSIQEMLDYAKSRKVKLVAYVYPIMGFEKDPGWLVGARKNRANLGDPGFQEWLIATLETFQRRTGISGYSFDHTFLNQEGTSRYAQWWGWRRILERLRQDIPDIVIDGRQAYQNYGPWSWLAGSYPHPTSTDEQPESFVSFPDLKLGRVSADRERYTAYRYREYEFAPSEIVPGFITHQTGRNDDSGKMPAATTLYDEVLQPFRARDWDYLGWRYSLLSSIAAAGWNNVLDMIPARDLAEFQHFSDDDRQWFRHWIDWADANKEFLRHTRMTEPALGKTDTSIAIVENAGYLFLFNPNGRRLPVTLHLDESIGLTRSGRYLVRELYPQERLIGRLGTGAWLFGNILTRDLDGGSVVVLQIEPEEPLTEPRLFNSPGTARIDGRVLRLTGIRGEAGTQESLLVAVPSKVDSVEVDGASMTFRTARSGLLQVDVTFEGEPFHHYQQLGQYDPQFAGGVVTADLRVPRRIFEQLAERRKAWPIPWTAEDYRSTWLVPERLLLYVQLAEPDDRWNATLKIDGQRVELQKAYASVRANHRNFVGFYADISKLSPDETHKLELDLPAGLKAGQFQGMFIENVETEYTGIVKP